MSEIVEKLKTTSIRSLNLMIQDVLAENQHVFVISQNRDAILMDFVTEMEKAYEKLQPKEETDARTFDFDNLTLVQNDELTAKVAFDGMVAAARNLHLPSFISFNTRLNTLLPHTRIDETTNPLDPLQIASSFSKSLENLKIDSKETMGLQRSMNNIVFSNLSIILRAANQLLVEHGVIPELDVENAKASQSSARQSPRFSTLDGEDTVESTEEQAKMFSVAQSLMRTDKTPAETPCSNPPSLVNTQSDSPDPQVDQHSFDAIHLVELLYQAILQDDSLPAPIKKLMGRTQITIEKVAASDTTFFDREDHPARMLLNEFASAGIGWSEVEKLCDDPLYNKIEELVIKLQKCFTGDMDIFDELIENFLAFKTAEVVKKSNLEKRILKATERCDRLEDIQELVTQKIAERVLGRNLPEFVNTLLDTYFHKFLVMLVLKEGPGSNAWKQSINTIDVLLWSVQPHKHEGDRDRLDTVNPRLLNNLRKALRVSKVNTVVIDSLISRLKEIQAQTFATGGNDENEKENSEEHATDLTIDNVDPIDTIPEEPLAADDPAFNDVDELSVGIWVEFLGPSEDETIRCKLAAKINAIDKFIFVNQRGIKVVEKTRESLAREIKENTVKVISDGLLFSRAMESVIGTLRESQHEQQTGGAYQPRN